MRIRDISVMRIRDIKNRTSMSHTMQSELEVHAEAEVDGL